LEDLSLQAFAVRELLKRFSKEHINNPNLAIQLCSFLLCHIRSPHANDAIRLLHRINIDVNWIYLTKLLSPTKIAMVADFSLFKASVLKEIK
jgi:hypothetical protein